MLRRRAPTSPPCSGGGTNSLTALVISLHVPSAAWPLLHSLVPSRPFQRCLPRVRQLRGCLLPTPGVKVGHCVRDGLGTFGQLGVPPKGPCFVCRVGCVSAQTTAVQSRMQRGNDAPGSRREGWEPRRGDGVSLLPDSGFSAPSSASVVCTDTHKSLVAGNSL